MAAQILPLKRAKPKHETRRFKFTVQRLKSLEQTGGTYYAYDTDQPGLCVRATKAGGKSFVFYRKVDGRPERITLGKVDAMGLDDARKACRQFEGQRAAGANPAAARREARRRGVTIGELMKAWLRSARARGLRSADKEERLWELHLEGRLSAKEAVNLTTPDLESLLHKIGAEHPRTANKCHDLLRRLYNHATKQGTINHTPCSGVSRYRQEARDRVLSKAEIERFLATVDAQPEPWRSYFKMLLLTGARRGAVASMRWQDVDLDQGVWTVPAWASKNKKALTVALVPQAVAVLRGIERLGDWVFPADSKSGHLTTPTKAWERIKKEAELEDVRIHDLRRTVGTTLAVKGASSHIIAKALGHASLASAASYVHLDADVARAALEGITEDWS